MFPIPWGFLRWDAKMRERDARRAHAETLTAVPVTVEVDTTEAVAALDKLIDALGKIVGFGCPAVFRKYEK
jgi:hypothetical protein